MLAAFRTVTLLPRNTPSFLLVTFAGYSPTFHHTVIYILTKLVLLGLASYERFLWDTARAQCSSSAGTFRVIPGWKCGPFEPFAPSLKYVSDCCTLGSSLHGCTQLPSKIGALFPSLKIVNVYTMLQTILTPHCLLLSHLPPAKLL